MSWLRRAPAEETLERMPPEPLEGTLMSLWNSQIPSWWAENIYGTQLYGTPDLANKVWVANRCQQLNAQQIASLPLVWEGPDETESEPMWISRPDGNLFPNGISDALFSMVDQLYGWGWSIQYITDFYASGWPRTFTVIPSSKCEPEFFEGARRYPIGDGHYLDPDRVIQIDRNPTTAAHGSSALKAYAQTAWGLLAAQNQAMTVSQGGIPQVVLKSERKLNADQATELQTQWMQATSRRNGAPPVLPPELSFEGLSFDPSELSLLETQEWNARVLATAYGVPAVALNMSLQGGLTYQNPTALMQTWWVTELRATAKRIADALSERMLPRGQFVWFDASDWTAELGGDSANNDPQKSQETQLAAVPTPLAAVGGAA